jgi:hypothetical protein
VTRRYQVQVRGTFGFVATSGGYRGGNATGTGWRPGITGTLNQTNETDAAASTFTSKRAAAEALRLIRREGAALSDTRVVELEPRPSGRSLTAAERRANGLELVQGLWLPAALVRELDEACKRRGEPRTTLVREALERALGR